jgi:enoyl-CoA hydratase/carnithine racemase
MATHIQHPELKVSVSGSVATVEICRPPHNYFDNRLIAQIGEAFEALDADPQCRAIVLAAEGKSFCSGANFSSPENQANVVKGTKEKHLYKEAIRLFRVRKPVVAAVHGPAVGGGLGLAMVADFRVSCSEARFSANFCRLGFHPGFGLTTTLPRIVGNQMAALMFYTGRRIDGDEAKRIGLVDVLVPQNEVRSAALALATEIAQSAPLAVMSARETMRRGLVDAIDASTERELVEQTWQRATEDFAEGIKAMAERRLPQFNGR